MPKRIDFSGRPRRDKRLRLAGLLETWRGRLLLEQWSITVVFELRQHPDNRLAAIDVSEQYSDMTVHVYPEFWQWPPKYQERSLVHELCHALVNRFANVANRGRHRRLEGDEITDAEENLTEQLTNIIWDAFEP